MLGNQHVGINGDAEYEYACMIYSVNGRFGKNYMEIESLGIIQDRREIGLSYEGRRTREPKKTEKGKSFLSF